MKRKTMGILCLLLSVTVLAQPFDVDQQLAYCHRQVVKALKELQPYDYTTVPRNILSNDKQQGWNCRKAVAEEWCSGFWPGILWMDYSATHDKEVRKAAEGYTRVLRDLAYRPIFDHDLGFIMLGAYGKGYEQNHDADYHKTLLAAADTLATLYNAKVGTLLSWPRHVKDYGGHNTIMDNMINLDLLFWAAANGGSPLLKQVAISHATTTMRHHFRPDGSCYHVAVYDTLTGDFLRGQTHQGYADYSMWARGQSWAIYGYTMVYRWTHDPVFLSFAQKVTESYLHRLKETSNDWVPLWDMDDPRPNAPKDASAACVVASALIDLAQYTGGYKGAYYAEAAKAMLADLSTDTYLSGHQNVSFLKHSTGHHPAGSEIDASIIYADYYYIEALLKLKHQQQ